MKKHYLTACAVAGLCVVAFAGPSQAQSRDDVLQRLEAKLDELSKENAALRDRVKRIESVRPTTAAASTPPAPRTDPARTTRGSTADASALSAHAAAYPVKAAVRPSCAADAFRGGYAGVHGGGVNWTANRTDQDIFVETFGGTQVQKKWGVLAGGGIGYNWTTCNTVWGVEVDGSWASANVTTLLFPNTFGPGNELSVKSRFDGLVTARARTGIVVDSLLLYLTGGLAAVHSRTIWTENFLPPGPFFAQVQLADWRWGMVAGFGTEWAWSDRVSIKSEVLYVDLPDRVNSVRVGSFGSPPAPANFTRSDSMWISRIGLNVKLGGLGGATN